MTSGGRELEIGPVPAGVWAVGVSGGADSVALLLAVRRRWPDVGVHVVHLNHETRGEASEGDAKFVAALAARVGVACTVARRGEVEARVAGLPANASARYRALRLALFREACRAHGLAGVLLAHHADDQAETVLHRLVRGSGLAGLAGMSNETVVGGLRIVRPMLRVRRAEIRRWLADAGEAWREDASNASDQYLRNRLRRALAGRDELVDALLEVGQSAGAARDWARGAAPAWGERCRVEELNALPGVLVDVAVRRWLAGRGVPEGEIGPDVVGRVVALAADAASAPAANLPGRLIARRRAGAITVESVRQEAR